jgi:hypothetical protein
MPYLTAPSAQKTERTYRYFVELASDKLDHERVPEKFQIVDVVVLEPTEQAIKTLIAAAGWLQGYTMVSHWVPEADDCDCF